jgi:mevalonate kinase
MKNENYFPAKLLLFGEYSILLGSSALSMPFNHFGASLKFIPTDHLPSQAVESNHQFKKMGEYFDANSLVFTQFLHLDKLRTDIRNGLYLASTIPERYGMGSSGALCAAVYDDYNIAPYLSSANVDSVNLGSLRTSLIQMESFFHGKSSGFDPLVSLLNTPLLINTDGMITPAGVDGWPMFENRMDILLVDSGKPCSTGPLVANFLQIFAPDGIITSQGIEMVNLVNTVIENLFTNDVETLWEKISQLSRFQLMNLPHLIPDEFRPLWDEGLKSGLFTLKLCGSGGGGFLLCFTREKDVAINYFKDHNTNVLNVMPKPSRF